MPSPPAVNISGRWDVHLEFFSSKSRHTLFLEQDGNKVSGTHEGRRLKGDLTGTADGEKVRLASSFPYEGSSLHYTFIGKVSGDAMEGDVDLDEYGKATFTARRHRYGSRA